MKKISITHKRQHKQDIIRISLDDDAVWSETVMTGTIRLSNLQLQNLLAMLTDTINVSLGALNNLNAPSPENKQLESELLAAGM